MEEENVHVLYCIETFHYRCDIQNVVFNENKEVKFYGEHLNGKTNVDVTYINISNCLIKKVPQGLTKIYPNLKVLRIVDSGLLEICKADLAEYKKLNEIRLSNNKLQFLPGDLFEGFQDLEKIYFGMNELNVVEPNLLDGLDKLKRIDFTENPGCMQTSLCAYKNENSEFVDLTDNIYYYKSDNDIDRMHQIRRIKIKLVKNFFVSKENVENFVKKFPNPLEVLQKYEDIADPKTEDFIIKFIAERKLNKIVVKPEPKTQKLQPSTLTEDLKKLTQNDDFKDFSIQIDDKFYMVHKFLLVARSPTLAELLKNNLEIENLKLVDIPMNTFEIILKFLYTDELPGDDGTSFIHLFAAAAKLKIETLKSYAATKIYDKITDENSMEILTLSNKYEHEELRNRAFAAAKRKYSDIEFKDDCAENPKKIAKLIKGYEAKLKTIENAKKKFKKLLENV